VEKNNLKKQLSFLKKQLSFLKKELALAKFIRDAN